MKADEYTPLEHTYGKYIEAVQAGTVSTFSTRYTRALHLRLQHTVDKYVLCISKSPSFKYLVLIELVVYLQVKGFLFSTNF